MRTGHTPSRQHPEYWSDCTIPWFTLADVWQLRAGARELGETSEQISELGLANSAAELLPAGTVVLSRTASVGFSGIMPVSMATSQDFWNWVPKPAMLSRFLWYQLQSMKPEFERLMMGSTHRTIYQGDAASLRIVAPPISEQLAIADYLDRETAQIDEFIAKNEELIALLAERRAAIVVHSVTRGIDTSVPLKASNVEWLGDVPAHWTIAGLAKFAKTVSGSGFPENEQGVEGAEIAFYKVNALAQADADGVIRSSWDTISRETAQALRAKILPPGTILLAKIGAALLLGRIRRTDRAACIDNNMMAIVPKQELSPRYASYALQTFDFETLANPGTVPSMDMYALMHRETAIPPLSEQIAIADYLDRRLNEIDAAIVTCRRGIQLATERRAALISAAVTGKIDVGVAV